jgi:hypothetical protein
MYVFTLVCSSQKDEGSAREHPRRIAAIDGAYIAGWVAPHVG